METNDTGTLYRSVRSVEPVCFATSHKALFHMNARGSLTATVLAEDCAALEFFTSGEWKRHIASFSDKNEFATYFGIFVEKGLQHVY